MIPVQPTLFWKYFHTKKSYFPKGVAYATYLSWEDGLWDIIRSYSIQKKSIILVPSFFCVDVMNNMKDHGLVPIYYEVNEMLQPNLEQLEELIFKIKPSILVLFHAVGITNKSINKVFFKRIPQGIFIIEDCVHRITNPQEVKIFDERHFIINSFRKVVPLQGSIVISKTKTINKLQGADVTVWYSFQVILLWIGMQILLTMQKYVGLFFGKWAEIAMLKGYDIIGDEQLPGNCPVFFSELYMYLNFEKIKHIKSKQVEEYKKHINTSEEFYTPQMSTLDTKELRGYPIVTSKKKWKKNTEYI
jgi:hypothetical protein